VNTPSEDLGNVNFGSKKLKERLLKVIAAFTKHPIGSILEACSNRHQAKAVYRMLSNKRFDIENVKTTYAASTVERIEACESVLLIQDTTEVNLNGHKKTSGLGYCDEYNLGILTHSCMAITPDGIPLGILNQISYTRPERKNESGTHDQKKLRPIEEKESYRWIESLEAAHAILPKAVNALFICDREGDFYEFYARGAEKNCKLLIRLVHNRVIQEHQKSLDYLRALPGVGSVVVDIPRDTRNGNRARKATLDVSYSLITFKKPARRRELHLPSEITATGIHIIEKDPPDGVEPIEWFLATTENVSSFEDAVAMLRNYVQRWKIERFHYVLKQGCGVEKAQERTFERQSSMIFLYSIIAIYIMTLQFLSRVEPAIKCDVLFQEEEWKILYCAANKTPAAPDEPYSLKEAVRFLGKLGGFAGSPSDGAPGAKVIWRGLKILYTLQEYHGYI
jgi:hypothetical protein